MSKPQKLPSGNWRVQVSKTVNGKLVRKSFTDPDKRKAELMAAKWLAEQEEQAPQKLTLRQAYEKYIEMKNNVLSPTTIRAYKSMSKFTFQAIMDLPLDKISNTLVQIEVNELSATVKPKSVRNAYGLLNAVVSTFCPNLTLRVTLPQKEKPSLYIPDDSEIKKLLKFVEGKNIEIPILLAAFGPMRRSEICALTSEDLNGNVVTVNKALVRSGKEWQIKIPKTYSSYRQIEYPKFVIEKIKNINGRLVEMTPNAITKMFEREIKKCGLPHFRFHDLRHYAVSTLHAINVPDKYIMSRGGWATNYTMNNVYNHTLKNAKDQTEEKITAHFNSVFNN
jgi:integrase